MKVLKSLFLMLIIIGCVSTTALKPPITPMSGTLREPLSDIIWLDEEEEGQGLPEPALTPTPLVVPKIQLSINSDRLALLLGPVNEAMADNFIAQLEDFDTANSKKNIYVIINSPGGAIFQGARMISAMKATKAPIICTVDSGAYSMAALLLQHCDKRYMETYSDIMYHEAHLGVEGSPGQIQVQLTHFQNQWNIIQAESAARMGLTLEEYKTNIINEWWMVPQGAFEAKAIDGVVDGLRYSESKTEIPDFPLFRFP